MKTLKDRIFEERQIKYNISFVGCTDSEGIPVSCTILVDANNQKEIEKYFENEQDNIFVHVEGGNIEY